MSDLAFNAMQFARAMHHGQRRKYTGAPYTDHIAEVARIVDSRESSCAVVWLHDVVEDCGVQLAEIEERFGTLVAIGVSGLSDVEIGNRAKRKQRARDRLAACWSWIQTIKCADLISNTSSIVMHDPKFAVTYLEEKRFLLAVLTKADPRLHAMACAQVAP